MLYHLDKYEFVTFEQNYILTELNTLWTTKFILKTPYFAIFCKKVVSYAI